MPSDLVRSYSLPVFFKYVDSNKIFYYAQSTDVMCRKLFCTVLVLRGTVHCSLYVCMLLYLLVLGLFNVTVSTLRLYNIELDEWVITYSELGRV
jgi:hypothetical protein